MAVYLAGEKMHLDANIIAFVACNIFDKRGSYETREACKILLHAIVEITTTCPVSIDCCMQHFDETCCGSESKLWKRYTQHGHAIHTCKSKQSLESAQRRVNGSLNREGNCFDEEQTWERAGLTGGSRRNRRGFDGLNLTN